MTSPTSNILGPLEVFNYPVFGCGNKTFRCNHSDLPVPPDPDIAGLGVSHFPRSVLHWTPIVAHRNNNLLRQR